MDYPLLLNSRKTEEDICSLPLFSKNHSPISRCFICYPIDSLDGLRQEPSAGLVLYIEGEFGRRLARWATKRHKLGWYSICARSSLVLDPCDWQWPMADGHLAWEPMTCWLPETDNQRPTVLCAIKYQLLWHLQHWKVEKVPWTHILYFSLVSCLGQLRNIRKMHPQNLSYISLSDTFPSSNTLLHHHLPLRKKLRSLRRPKRVSQLAKVVGVCDFFLGTGTPLGLNEGQRKESKQTKLLRSVRRLIFSLLEFDNETQSMGFLPPSISLVKFHP